MGLILFFHGWMDVHPSRQPLFSPPLEFPFSRFIAAQPLFTWGTKAEVEKAAGKGVTPPSLAELRSSYGWCLNDRELAEMQGYQDVLTDVTTAYMDDEDIRRLRIAVEIAYQSRAWTDEGRSDARLAHAVAVAKTLAELQMEAEAVIAALLAGVCEETGLQLKQVNELLGPAVAGAVRDVTNVWRLSELLQNAPAEDSEQLEHRCQIVLAGCDDWRGIVLSLASRLVAARTLQGEAQVRAEAEILDEERVAAERRAQANLQAELDVESRFLGDLQSQGGGIGGSPGSTSRMPIGMRELWLLEAEMGRGALDVDAQAADAAVADSGVVFAPAVPPEAESKAPPAPPLSSSFPASSTSSSSASSTTVVAGGEAEAGGAPSSSRRKASKAEALVSSDAPADEVEADARRFALQTLQVFVPLAHRLGMWYFKSELEERCFALTRPREFATLSAQLEEVKDSNADTLQSTASRLRQALLDDPVLSQHTDWVRVQARAKAAYSAHTKMQRQGTSLQELDDLLGLRVIFRPKVTRKLPIGLHRQRQCILCYRVLEVAHSLYPMAARKNSGKSSIKDYVTTPKANGYQSLHSTIRLNPNTTSELQIRTSEMHRYAEHGKAAHWLFKLDDGRPADDWYDLGLDEAVMSATASAIKADRASAVKADRAEKAAQAAAGAPPAASSSQQQLEQLEQQQKRKQWTQEKQTSLQQVVEEAKSAAAESAPLPPKAPSPAPRRAASAPTGAVKKANKASSKKEAICDEEALVDAAEQTAPPASSSGEGGEDVVSSGSVSVGSSSSSSSREQRVTWFRGSEVDVGLWQREGEDAEAPSSSQRDPDATSAAGRDNNSKRDKTGTRSSILEKTAVSGFGKPSSDEDARAAAVEQGSKEPGNKERKASSAIQRSQPVLEAVRTRLREKRVYATTVDGTVLSLRAGADLQEALAKLRERSGTPGQGPIAARVNGRTVRKGYKIRNGDVLTPLQVTGLNSLAWVAPPSAPGKSSKKLAQRLGVSDVDEFPDWGSLPVPWPWSLLQDEEADTMSWFLEAEAKHGAVAALALANWLALASLGEVSLDTEPLGSLYLPLPQATWCLQGGAVALAEASALQSSTSAFLRERESIYRRRLGGEEEDGDASVDRSSGGAESSSGAKSPLRRGDDKFVKDFERGFRIGAPSFAWSVGFVEILSSIRNSRQAEFGRSWQLACGRIAMTAMAALALHADINSGILHEFLEVGGEELNGPATTLAAPRPEQAAEPISEEEFAAASLAESLASDVVLQDIPDRF